MNLVLDNLIVNNAVQQGEDLIVYTRQSVVGLQFSPPPPTKKIIFTNVIITDVKVDENDNLVVAMASTAKA